MSPINELKAPPSQYAGCHNQRKFLLCSTVLLSTAPPLWHILQSATHQLDHEYMLYSYYDDWSEKTQDMVMCNTGLVCTQVKGWTKER